jgi:Flp pilus assembly protein TadD
MSRPNHAALAAAPPPPVAAGAAPAQMDGGLMGESGSRDALQRLRVAARELKSIAARPAIDSALAAIRRDDAETGAKEAIRALEIDEQNGVAWYLLGIARERSGDFVNSVQAFEMALRLLPDHVEIANNLGRLAMRMNMKVQAEKFFRHFLVRYPDSVEGANNLACAVRDLGRHAEAIELLRPAILAHPGEPMLWSTMGSIVAEQGDFESANAFFAEALRLNPDFHKARYNQAHARLALGDPEGALTLCDQAMAGVRAEDERQMMRLLRSTILIAMGRLAEGWEDYEARIHPQYSDLMRFAIEHPLWEPGADLTGKTVMVMGEQGLGDEVLFANLLPDVQEKVGPDGHVIVAVEPRLVTLFARSFPDLEVGAHLTYKYMERPLRVAPMAPKDRHVDLWTPMACMLREFRRDVADFPPDRVGYLKADPERVAYWRERLARELPDSPKVGILWKSGVATTARARFFATFPQWEPVLTTPGVTFVNLQYDDCSAEMSFAKEAFGIDIWTPDGLDLKQDLDEVTALCCALDLVVGFSNATFNLAAAAGAPSWLISSPGAWPRLGLPDSYPWYPQVKVFAPQFYGEWDKTMGEVAEALASFAEASER